MTKIDARKLTVEGRRVLREQVIRLHKQSGLTRKALAAIAGVHVRTVEVWVSRAAREGDASAVETMQGHEGHPPASGSTAPEEAPCDLRPK